MNARQKAKKLKKENKYLIDNWMPRFPKREKIKVTQIPTEHYKAKIRVHRRILEEDGMAYVKRELALQTARMLEEKNQCGIVYGGCKYCDILLRYIYCI